MTKIDRIEGTLTTTNRLVQTVNISGSKGDTFVLAGWARGDSAPLGAVQNRTFSIIATFLYNGTAVGTKQVDYNADADGSVSWQYVAAPVVADENYTHVKLELAYDYNANTVYFDGIQLYREEYGTSYTYDPNGNVTSVIDLQKLNTTYEYNTDGDLAKIIQDGQTKMTYTYDECHNVKTATSQENLSYSFEYDAHGNNTKVSITSDGKTMSSMADYTDDGNYLDYTLDALGNKTDYTYDAQTGELESVEYPNGAGTTTTYTYDEMYRLISAAASTGTQNLSAAYTYTDDLLTKITTGSTEYNFTYGVFGLRTSVKAGSRTLATYEYTYDPDGGDRNKYLKELLYGNGNAIEYTYDSYGRVIGEIYKDEGDSTPDSEKETVAYKYDNDGLLASVHDSESGRTTGYSYDLIGRLVKYREAGTGYDHSVSYTYDQKNNLTQLAEKIGTDTYTTDYGYDDDNRITSVTSNGGTAAATDDITVAYSYDGFGRVSSQQTKKGSSTLLTRAYTFSQGKTSDQTTGQVASLTVSGTGYNANYSYEYDANGNITRVTSGGKSTRYTYDSQNQLIREDNQAAGKSWTWTYDKGGNIQSKSEYAYTTGTLGSAQSTVNYTYDSTWGDLLVSYNGTPVTYDTIGNPAALNGRSYTWEHGRELEKVTYLGTQWTNTYDANGMRTKRESTGKTYSYVYTGSQLTQMTVGNTVLYFEYDASGTPVTMRTGNEVYHYITNIQGDVLGFYNTGGTKAVSYTYDAWGKLLTATDTTGTGLDALNPLRYRGYVYDVETGLYYLQTRYYDPEVGRFINADAFATTGIGLVGNNAFAYCNNNPVNLKDYRGYLPGVAHTVTPYISQHDDGAGGNIRSGPRSDLANRPDLDINTAPPESYNCYGNGIGKQVSANPSGYKMGDSTRTTFEAVKKDLGSDNVRELDSIDAPIEPDEFKVAMKCGPTDYHFIRLTPNGWYNKSGDEFGGLYVDQSYVTSNVWYARWICFGFEGSSSVIYDDETIYFAVKVGWDEA